MEKAIFSVRFEANKMELTELGQDSVVFYMSTNPGEPLKPLAKIASGGELSRMMLALKTIFSRHQGITSIIFDEVDTGVSGRVGQAIAEKNLCCFSRLASTMYQSFASSSSNGEPPLLHYKKKSKINVQRLPLQCLKE